MPVQEEEEKLRNNIKRTCNMENVNYDQVLRRKHEWNEHMSRMDEGRKERIPRDKLPLKKKVQEDH